jgi:hypothetical protein
MVKSGARRAPDLTETTYETVAENFVFQQHWCGHLGMLLVVVFDKVGICHAILLFDEDGGLDYLSEPLRARVPSFENHRRLSVPALTLTKEYHASCRNLDLLCIMCLAALELPFRLYLYAALPS